MNPIVKPPHFYTDLHLLSDTVFSNLSPAAVWLVLTSLGTDITSLQVKFITQRPESFPYRSEALIKQIAFFLERNYFNTNKDHIGVFVHYHTLRTEGELMRNPYTDEIQIFEELDDYLSGTGNESWALRIFGPDKRKQQPE